MCVVTCFPVQSGRGLRMVGMGTGFWYSVPSRPTHIMRFMNRSCTGQEGEKGEGCQLGFGEGLISLGRTTPLVAPNKLVCVYVYRTYVYIIYIIYFRCNLLMCKLVWLCDVRTFSTKTSRRVSREQPSSASCTIPMTGELPCGDTMLRGTCKGGDTHNREEQAGVRHIHSIPREGLRRLGPYDHSTRCTSIFLHAPIMSQWTSISDPSLDCVHTIISCSASARALRVWGRCRFISSPSKSAL